MELRRLERKHDTGYRLTYIAMLASASQGAVVETAMPLSWVRVFAKLAQTMRIEHVVSLFVAWIRTDRTSRHRLLGLALGAVLIAGFFLAGVPMDEAQAEQRIRIGSDPGTLDHVRMLGIENQAIAASQYNRPVQYAEDTNGFRPGLDKLTAFNQSRSVSRKATTEIGENRYALKPVGTAAFESDTWISEDQAGNAADSDEFKGTLDVDAFVFHTIGQLLGISEARAQYASSFASNVVNYVVSTPREGTARVNGYRLPRADIQKYGILRVLSLLPSVEPPIQIFRFATGQTVTAKNEDSMADDVTLIGFIIIPEQIILRHFTDGGPSEAFEAVKGYILNSDELRPSAIFSE